MAKALVLHYPTCSTCKKALKWLDEHAVPVEERDIEAAPPTLAELEKWIDMSDVPLHKWLNTSGNSYKAMGGKAKFETMTDAGIKAALVKDGMLIKRPVVISGHRVLVGFSEANYEQLT